MAWVYFVFGISGCGVCFSVRHLFCLVECCTFPLVLRYLHGRRAAVFRLDMTRREEMENQLGLPVVSNLLRLRKGSPGKNQPLVLCRRTVYSQDEGESKEDSRANASNFRNWEKQRWPFPQKTQGIIKSKYHHLPAPR